MNAIEQVKKFQVDRELDKQEFDEWKIFTNIFEELVEMLGYKVRKEDRDKLREELKIVIPMMAHNGLFKFEKQPEDEDRVDALCDIAVFALGDLMKLGYEPECSLLETAKEINSRTGVVKNGRFYKDEKAKVYKADYSKCRFSKS